MSEISPREKESVHSHLAGLAPILLALILGILLGVIHGREMWMAGGGPATYERQLQRTLKQKTDQLNAARQEVSEQPGELVQPTRQEAIARLEEQVTTIQSELTETSNLVLKVNESPRSPLAYFLWRATAFLGELFLRMLKLLVLPLVVTSMICGIAALGDIRHVGRIGGVTVAYFVATTCLAVFIGLVLVQTIQPGRSADDTFSVADARLEQRSNVDPVDTILELIVGQPSDAGSGMVPANIVQSGVNLNVLGLITFALVFGGALTTLGERGKAALEFFNTVNDAILQMVRLAMWFAPIGIFGLVAFNIASKGGGEAFAEQVSRLGWYVMTVSVGLLLQFFCLWGILWAVGRNPIRYTLNVGKALLTAVSTASSSATLPLSIETSIDNNKITRKSANFVLPLGATINMNGTALYEAVAALFIAQSLGIELPFADLLIVFITATLAAVGAAGIPEAGLVTMVLVLTAVGLPTTGIGTILAVDWFLDRLRTTINVFGDTVGCAVTDRFEGESIPVEEQAA